MNRLIGSHILVIIVVVLIGFGGYYVQWYLDSTASELVVQLEGVMETVKQEDWEGSDAAYAGFEENWETTRKNWALVIDHMEIDNIQEQLSRGKFYIEAEDADSAGAEIDAAIMFLEHIPDRERLTLHNIF
ncbi:MAG: DUF4363 family protein [Syntrophaceticus sp.]|nr:DUF4363 family protein [Syntrophaceticus sp.]MDD4783832.1 DUF4363 family protein [Syntrophaceticus sp.]